MGAPVPLPGAAGASGVEHPAKKSVGARAAADGRAAALARPGAAFEVTAGDLRRALRRGREANLVVLLLDTSRSMAARRRGRAVATTALSLLGDAYRRRDRVALLTFRAEAATVVVPPTRSTELAARRLRDFRSGGRTLAAGLEAVRRTVGREAWLGRRPLLLVVVTDGRATGHGERPRPGQAGRGRAGRHRHLQHRGRRRGRPGAPRTGRRAGPAAGAELITVPDLASPIGARRELAGRRLADIIRAKEVA